MDATHDTPVSVVRAWIDAVNSRKGDRVIELSDPNIEIIGPRGSGHGHQLLREWLGHARVQLESLRVFSKGDLVVVAQHGIWRSVQTGKIIGETDVASQFRVEGARVIQYARYDTLDQALKAAGLGYDDEMV